MILNLGCGSNKIPGAINIDVEKSCNPDLVVDFLTEKLPYSNESIHEVYLFHTIEHIQKFRHRPLLREIHRVLSPTGRFLCSFPEFKKCYKNWEMNKNGNKDFWEATMFGRQLYPSDYHVCTMDTIDFTSVLLEIGFEGIKSSPESEPNEFNTVISALRGTPYVPYEVTVVEDTNRFQFQRVGQK